MRRLLSIIIMMLFSAGIAYAGAVEEQDKRLLNLLENPVIKNDRRDVKILELKFKKAGESKYSEYWESYIKLKSCYTEKTSCDIYLNLSSPNFSFDRSLFNGLMEGQSVADQTWKVKIHKDDIGEIISSEIKIICEPVNADPPHIPIDNWKQYLPEPNECIDVEYLPRRVKG